MLFTVSPAPTLDGIDLSADRPSFGLAGRNNLFQLAVELVAVDPIYLLFPTPTADSSMPMQGHAIDKFLADSRRYLAG